jgi:hypothetical protein
MSRSTLPAYSNDVERFANRVFTATYFRPWSERDIRLLREEWEQEKEYHDQQQKMTDSFRGTDVLNGIW